MAWDYKTAAGRPGGCPGTGGQTAQCQRDTESLQWLGVTGRHSRWWPLQRHRVPISRGPGGILGGTAEAQSPPAQRQRPPLGHLACRPSFLWSLLDPISVRAISMTFLPAKRISFIDLISPWIKSPESRRVWRCFRHRIPANVLLFFFQITCMVLVLLPRQTYKRITFQERKDLNGCSRDSAVFLGEVPGSRHPLQPLGWGSALALHTGCQIHIPVSLRTTCLCSHAR